MISSGVQFAQTEPKTGISLNKMVTQSKNSASMGILFLSLFTNDLKDSFILCQNKYCFGINRSLTAVLFRVIGDRLFVVPLEGHRCDDRP